MVKRALLVGCNYPGTNAALQGCINDVWGTKDMLIKYYGFVEADIVVMIDTDPAYIKPTGKAMKDKMREMVQISKDGDILVMHFSGHGTQVPSDNPNEQDGKDEALCPSDLNVITDKDLRIIFGPLPPGCKFTFIADCCHSGTMLDHQEVIVDGPKTGGPAPPAVDGLSIQSLLSVLGASGNREMKNRALPMDDLFSMLSGMLGKSVGKGNARSSMGQLFGKDASATVQDFMKYAQMAQAGLAMLQKQTGGDKAGESAPQTGFMGMLTKLLGACAGGGAAGGGAAGGAAGGGAAAGGGLGALGSLGGLGAIMASLNGGTAPVAPQAGVKPPHNEQLPDDVGILVTGCQDKETSADVRPDGDASRAHGALSQSLHTIVKNHHEQQPGMPLTNRNVVIGVRTCLAKTGFTQNPCLECATKYADSAFILN